MVSLREAKRPFVVAIDLGTSSARSVLYDAEANTVEGMYAQIPYQMTTTPDGGVEIDANHLLDLVYRVIDDLLQKCAQLKTDLAGQVAVVGTCTFWHSLLGVDEAGEAITPLFNWNDTRSRDFAVQLEAEVGRSWLHERTGCLPHSSYYPAKIRWLRATNPELARRVRKWISIGEYLFSRIFGSQVISPSMASGTGLLNPRLRNWDSEVLNVLKIDIDFLSSVAESRQYVAELKPDFAARWPLLSQVKWALPIGDGAASNIGSGCVTSSRIAINVGTSGAMRVCYKSNNVPMFPGLWVYLASRDYVVIGGALSNAGDVYAWCRDTLRIEHDDIDDELAQLEPDSHGLTVLPFFSGERSTGWADHARAAVTGMTLNTTALEIVQAMLEAVAFRFAAIFDLLRPELSDESCIVASGGAILRSSYIPQLLADVIGVPVTGSLAPEASSRGAAIFALVECGQISSFEALDVPLGKTYEPRQERYEQYREARRRQERLYKLLVEEGLGESD